MPLRPSFGVYLGLLVALWCASPSVSRAQATTDTTPTPVADKPLKADFKGMVGLGLIGGELGMVIPAIAGARGAWPYIVFPVIGAGGGAVAGYFLLEKGSGHPELAVASLVTGMALLIPSLVLTLAETSYEPPETDVGIREAKMLAAAGPGLVRFAENGVRVAPPGVSVGSSVTAEEALRTGATRARTVHASLVSGVF